MVDPASGEDVCPIEAGRAIIAVKIARILRCAAASGGRSNRIVCVCQCFAVGIGSGNCCRAAAISKSGLERVVIRVAVGNIAGNGIVARVRHEGAVGACRN